jgi:putative hydrolase of the HAD superfamily
MALLCLDLDNTLIDRTGAFRRWAADFVDRHGVDPHEVGWMMEVDLDSLAERNAVFQAIRSRFALTESVEELTADYRLAVPKLIEPYAGCLEALEGAKARGWHPWLVTNGEIEVQMGKMAATGLDAVLDGWVISEEAGASKPHREIFDVCASRSGQPLDSAWMVGDNAPVDIGGAHNAGVRSVWLHRNRHWEEDHFAPTAQAGSITEALELIGAPTP